MFCEKNSAMVVGLVFKEGQCKHIWAEFVRLTKQRNCKTKLWRKSGEAVEIRTWKIQLFHDSFAYSAALPGPKLLLLMKMKTVIVA